MWEGLDTEMDPAFLERDARRKAGKPVEIARTERLIVRETILKDVPDLYKIWREPGTSDYIRPMQPTLEEELEFMEAYIRHAYAFYDFGLWTVLEKESGQVVGRAGVFLSEILENAVELGYMVASRRRRMGYALECGRAVLAYARDTLDMTEIHLLSDCRNIASVRTAEALGFVKAEKLCFKEQKLIHLVWKDCQTKPRSENVFSGCS